MMMMMMMMVMVKTTRSLEVGCTPILGQTKLENLDFLASNSRFISGSNYPLVICYIAIENGSLTVDLPTLNGDFP